MNSKPKTSYIKFYGYVNDITIKRINILMPISIGLLFLLMFFDLSLRDSSIAMYSRTPSIILSISLLILYNFKVNISKTTLTLIYNIYLSSILAMMFAKFFIHIEANTASVNVIGVLIAIFIISLEVRANLINTIIIYLLPVTFFLLTFYFFFSPYFNENFYTPLINVGIFLIAGFIINKVQNNFRFQAFVANQLLSIEKKKLENSNDELKIYQDKLTDLVKEKTISLQSALEKATESDKLKTCFLLNISHEIRTPINAVKGFIELISKKDKGIETEFKIIDDNFNILIKTIEDILFLSRLHSEELKIVKTEIQSNILVKNMFTFLKTEIKNSNKDIVPVLEYNDNDNDNFIIKSNDIYLKKALGYIIDNAIKFSNSGEIKLQCYKKNNSIILKIIDNGQGISKENLPYIFDNFRKFENKNTLFRGVGIGISIAKELMSLLSGEIKVKSEIGIGTSVKIII